MGTQAFCIHGHFYQPPREDPLSGEIPNEAGAAPYSNWNERIYHQCYKPNAALGNFEHISFNIGPTLFEWMARHHRETASAIIDQDHRNLARYGVGNAMAQSYNHTILPLASRLDKITQVNWGIADFEYRFGHRPIGMWLPETAVDLETLEVLADCGIEFTILAPWQAADPNLDFSRPYQVKLSAGRQIAVFFYNMDLSTRVSFDPGSTSNADRFLLEILLPKFNWRPAQEEPQFIMIASDGELYGHHQHFRDKFLAYLLDGAMKGKPIQVVFPALWLRQYGVHASTEIRDRTSWSCHHGVTRWSGDCSCTPNSTWKEPMRQALNNLAEALDNEYLKVTAPLLKDPWQLRHEYIHVIQGQMDVAELASSLVGRRLDATLVHTLTLLLRAQYERQRMFTSCGWFFDDFDRIEPRNNIAYATQAVWLTEQATGVDLYEQMCTWLKPVVSWRTQLSADVVFSQHLERARQSLGEPD